MGKIYLILVGVLVVGAGPPARLTTSDGDLSAGSLLARHDLDELMRRRPELHIRSYFDPRLRLYYVSRLPRAPLGRLAAHA